MKEITGDLIALAKEGYFDVIGHGCNCFCTMKSGIAVPFVKEFGCNQLSLEGSDFIGDISKLGRIESVYIKEYNLHVVNMYTQYLHRGLMEKMGVKGIPLSYDALRKCLTRLLRTFEGKRIGLPLIGCGLAGGSWSMVSGIIDDVEQMMSHMHHKPMEITIVKLPEK